MHNTIGYVALMNISQETNCSHVFAQYPKQKFFALLKVTVQFEPEGNDQNEIFSHMDRSDVKL